jgi:ABC-type multidrug transport system ATPase subunit
VRLEGVGRRYRVGGPWVLRDVDLEVPGGALTRIEGANGTGKSTLLRVLAGIDAPSAGRITGRPRTAYVPERFPAALPFTAVGYLTHLGRIHGLRGREPARRAVAWLDRFGIAGYADTPMERLSKGTAQKVAVAQALLAEPELLVLDEAWTGLDTAARTRLDDAVTERVAAGGSVVFVDHDPRRLAHAAPTTHRVVGSRLVADASASGAHLPPVVIEASGPGAPPLPKAARASVISHRPLRVATHPEDSDTVLRALLTASPPWHVHSVRPVPPEAPREETR